MSHFATKDNTTLESEKHLVFLVLPLFHSQPPSYLEYISQTPEARGWGPPKKASWPPLDILLSVRSRPHWRLSKDKNGRQGPHFTPYRLFLPVSEQTTLSPPSLFTRLALHTTIGDEIYNTSAFEVLPVPSSPYHWQCLLTTAGRSSPKPGPGDSLDYLESSEQGWLTHRGGITSATIITILPPHYEDSCSPLPLSLNLDLVCNQCASKRSKM